MTAKLMIGTIRQYLAWCDKCQDGIQDNNRSNAEDWIYLHNRKRHAV